MFFLKPYSSKIALSNDPNILLSLNFDNALVIILLISSMIIL